MILFGVDDYNPDGSKIISIPIDTVDPSSSPGYQSSQSSTVTSEPSSKMDPGDNPNRPNNKYQQNLLAKIYRDIPKSNGLPNEIGVSHVQKLCDILSILGISIDDETADEDGDAEMVIRVFVTSLQGAARSWYKTNIKDQYPGNTVRAWKAIREEFLKRYNPAGETVARQLNTLMKMKWDPLAESIDSFAYCFGQMFSGLQGEYTDALFMGCIPEVYKTHL